MKAKLLCLLLCALPSWTMKAQEEGTANLYCRFYLINVIGDDILFSEGPYKPKSDDISLISSDGTSTTPSKESNGYWIYENIPTGTSLLTYSFPGASVSTSGPEPGTSILRNIKGVSSGFILEPGDNYFFIRVFTKGEIIPKVENKGNCFLLPKALVNVWDENNNHALKAGKKQNPDYARDALVGAPECGISDDGKYYLASRKTLNCQIVDGGLLFSIKPEYRKK